MSNLPENGGVAADASGRGPSPAAAWYAAVLICLITAIAMADRLAISMLIGPIKQDFGIGDFMAGLLIGAAFSVFYALFLLPIGWAADRWSRRRVLMLCLATWTVATMACGLAAGFISLFLARALTGAGEAGMAPTTHAILGASFPRQALAKPVALQGIGLQLGSALGIAAAGAVLAAGASGDLAAIPVIGTLEPWRAAFIIIGLPGVIAIALVPTLPEPQAAQTGASRVTAIGPFIRRHSRLVVLTITAGAVLSIGLGVVTGWAPEYLQRIHGLSPGEAGAALGSVFLAAAIVSQAVYSVAVDAAARRGVDDATLRIGLIPVVAAVPLTWCAFTAPTAAGYLAWQFALLCCLSPCTTMFNTAVQQLAPTAYRSRLSAMLILAVSLAGFTLGPASVGALTEYVVGEARLGAAMTLVISTAFVIGAALLFLLLAPTRSYLAAKQGGTPAGAPFIRSGRNKRNLS